MGFVFTTKIYIFLKWSLFQQIAPRIAAYIKNATSKLDSCVRERCITLKGDLFFFEQVEEGEGGTRKQEDDELDQLSVKSVGT